MGYESIHSLCMHKISWLLYLEFYRTVLILFVFVVFLGSNKISGMLPEYQRSVHAGPCNPKLKSSLQELLGSGGRRSAWKTSDPQSPSSECLCNCAFFQVNLTELKTFPNPPNAVTNVTAAVMVLMAPRGRVPKDRSWKAAKIFMGKVSLAQVAEGKSQ